MQENDEVLGYPEGLISPDNMVFSGRNEHMQNTIVPQVQPEVEFARLSTAKARHTAEASQPYKVNMYFV